MNILPHLKLSSLVAILPLLTSCALVFEPSTRDLKIIPSEPDAHIYLDGRYMGKGEMTLTCVPSGHDCIIIAQKENHIGRVRVGGEMSTWGVVDAWSFPLIIPTLVSMSFSNAFQFDRDTVYVRMIDRPPLTPEELRPPHYIGN